MSDRRRVRALMAGSAVIVGLVLVASPTVAHAAEPTSVSFVDTTPVEVEFGAEWELAVSVTTPYDTAPVPVGRSGGTVTVYVSGVPGEFASGVPLQADGRAYISQPSSGALLAAGEYDVTAVYVPAQGSYLAGSQTATPARLVVTPLDVTPHASVENDAAVSPYPLITATLSGSYVESRGGAPAGTWQFRVLGPDETEITTIDVAQGEGAVDPLRVEITSELRDGTEYTVQSSFIPVPEYTGGVTAADVADATFTTPGVSIIDAIASRVAFPFWAVILLGVLVAGLVTAVVLLGVRLSRRSGTAGDLEDSTPRAESGSGDPAELAASGPVDATELLDTSDVSSSERRSWSLSLDTPTELITTADVEELALAHEESPEPEPQTEIIETGDSEVGDADRPSWDM